MSLFTKFKNGLMTILAGIESNNGTTPTTLPQPGLNNKSLTDSILDLHDSGPTNVANNNHQQNYTPSNKYMDNPPV